CRHLSVSVSPLLWLPLVNPKKPSRRSVYVAKILSNSLAKKVSDETAAAASWLAGHGAGLCGARRRSIRAISDLCYRSSTERLVGCQRRASHHSSRKSSRSRHPGPREGYRAEPKSSQSHRCSSHPRRHASRRDI